MPPAARIVGLIFALAGSVCLAAQTDSRPAPAGAPAGNHGSLGDESLSKQASRALHAELATGSDQFRPVGKVRPIEEGRSSGEDRTVGEVRPAVYESPALGGDAAQVAQEPRHAGGAAQGGDEVRSGAISPPGHDAPIRLPPPGQSGRKGKTGAAPAGGLTSLVTVASSLGVVLGLFLVVAWAMRRTVPGGSTVLPSEVVEVLGRAALAGKAQVHLVRCGSKLLLVSLSPTGVETLTEITDPDEVTRLVGLCREAQPGSTTAAFRQVLQQFAGQRTPPGLSGATSDDVRLANAGVPGTRYRGLEGHDV